MFSFFLFKKCAKYELKKEVLIAMKYKNLK